MPCFVPRLAECMASLVRAEPLSPYPSHSSQVYPCAESGLSQVPMEAPAVPSEMVSAALQKDDLDIVSKLQR